MKEKMEGEVETRFIFSVVDITKQMWKDSRTGLMMTMTKKVKMCNFPSRTF